MKPQLSPEDLISQSELICEKLLGWKKRPSDIPGMGFSGWCVPNGPDESTPSFATWAEAGLILEALSARGTNPSMDYRDGKWDCYGGDPFESFFHAYADTGPLAIRAAALQYIKAVKS